jgi:DNA-binding PadR family transcriptional regulator
MSAVLQIVNVLRKHEREMSLRDLVILYFLPNDKRAAWSNFMVAEKSLVGRTSVSKSLMRLRKNGFVLSAEIKDSDDRRLYWRSDAGDAFVRRLEAIAQTDGI